MQLMPSILLSISHIHLSLFLLLFKYSFLPFPSTPAQHPSPPHLPSVSIPTLCFVPSPYSPEISSPLPSGHCQPVLNFSVCGYILLACSFWLGSVRGEVIWYLSLTAWLISLSIMLSSPTFQLSKLEDDEGPTAMKWQVCTECTD